MRAKASCVFDYKQEERFFLFFCIAREIPPAGVCVCVRVFRQEKESQGDFFEISL